MEGLDKGGGKQGNELFRCYACRSFELNEVVSVYGGKSIWRSNAAYECCTVARDLFAAPAEHPVAYSRARDGMVQVLDSEGCHLLMGAACCRTGEEANPNLTMNDSGEYVAISMIRAGDELVVENI